MVVICPGVVDGGERCSSVDCGCVTVADSS